MLIILLIIHLAAIILHCLGVIGKFSRSENLRVMRSRPNPSTTGIRCHAHEFGSWTR